jgi:hypothetical protein
MANDDSPRSRDSDDHADSKQEESLTPVGGIGEIIRREVANALQGPANLGELYRLPESPIMALAENPTAMAREIVSLRRQSNELTWAILGLGFVLWLLLMARR